MTTPIFRLYPKEFGDEPPPGFSSRAKFIHQALHLIDRSLATSGQKLMLRAMLVEGASVDGMMNVAWMVHNLDDPHDDVGPLADSFINLVVKPVLAAGGRTPTTSTPVSPFPDEALAPIAQATRQQQIIREKCLPRENWTCPVTGQVDYKAPKAVRDRIPAAERGALVTSLQAAHIIPLSMNDLESTDADAAEMRAVFRTALTAFCGRGLGSLQGKGINGPDNMIILSSAVHRYQGRLQLAFEEVEGEQDTYAVVTYDEADGWDFRPRVTFRDHSSNGTKLPSPFHLKLHATLCKALHASGRADELIRALDELDEAPPAVLATNGNSAELLQMAMYRSMSAEHRRFDS